MENIADITQYNVVATISNNNECCVWIAYLKRQSGNLYLINRFENTEKNSPIFKELFSYYSDHKNKDIVNFFASDKHFYVVFKYFKSESIKNRFQEDLLTDKLEKRFEILYSILLKLNDIYASSEKVLASIISLNNICVDLDGKVGIIYNLQNIFKTQKNYDKIIFRGIADIISLMLKHELKNKFNSQVRIIVEKCKDGLFRSIPELIFELKKIEKTCTDLNTDAQKAFVKNISNSFISKFYNKTFFRRHKKQIKKYSLISISCIIIFLLSYLLYNTFITNNKIPTDTQIFKLGNTTYTYNDTNDNSIENSISVPSVESKEESIDLSISPETEITFEDYIVQYGDTFDSICENKYSSKNFVSTIKSFNNMQSDSQLVAGMIIRLPDETKVKTLLNAY